ncbi:tyrosine-type recombinase/integrase [Crenobacter intestini]|nr:tyrosine-type recombinase/integrase [Crenobacter intestini]
MPATRLLTAKEIENAKLPAGEAELVLRDGDGLELRLRPRNKQWRFRYSWNGGRAAIIICPFGETKAERAQSTKIARAAADQYRAWLRPPKDGSGTEPRDPREVLAAAAVERQREEEAERARIEAEETRAKAEREAEERAAAELTMDELFAQWDASHGVMLAPHWRAVRQSHWRCHVSPLVGRLKVSQADRAPLIKHYDRLKKAGKDATAKVALALVKQVVAWGADRALVDESHPLLHLRVPRANRIAGKRQSPDSFDAAKYLAKHGDGVIGEDAEDDKAGRALKLEEVVELLNKKLPASSQAETGKAIIRLMLATGIRASQAVALRWKWVLLDRRVIIFPAGTMKAGKTHHVHLSDYAAAQLAQMLEFKTGEFVFQAPRKANAHVRRDNVGTDISKRQLYKDASATDEEFAARVAKRMESRRCRKETDLYNMPFGKWTLYDLRRTAATLLMGLVAADWDVVQRILAHADPHGVTGRYVRFSAWDDRCKALDELGRALEACQRGEQPSADSTNVIGFARKTG